MARLLIVLLVSLAAAAVAAVPPRHVRAELVSEVTAVVPGKAFYVGLRERIDPGWHTYWRNPGDAGAPTRIAWHLPPGFAAGAIQWPRPQRVPYGPLMDYGYSGEVLLPVRITAPADLAGAFTTLKAHARWLVCSDICVPEQADLELTLPVSKHADQNASVANAFAEARRRIPRDIGVKSTWRLAGDNIELHLDTTGAVQGTVESAAFFPYREDVIDNAARQRFRIAGGGLDLTLQKGRHFSAKTSQKAASLAGVVELTSSGANTTAFEIHPVRVAGEARPPGIGFVTAILFAFLGGLILNLMPCVFPVLSVKVLSLVEHRAQGTARRNGWVYAAGVVASFIAVAAALILLRAAGAQIGWGFQLQSPAVIAVLVYLFFLVGLNFSGYFEAGTSLMNLGGGLASRPGLTGAFFSGVLVTVVAAPCTAPFMAGAVGYALLANNLVALLIFAALGAGVAAPYLLLCHFPAFVRVLPRPGPWMETFKEFLAFPMYGSAVWLVWVLDQEAGAAGVVTVLAGTVLLTAAIWTHRRARGRVAVVILALILALGALILPFSLHGAAAGSSDRPGAGYAGPVWEPWSEARLAALRKTGPVFVDFTAAWCITCKVNEAVALDSARVKAAFEARHVRYLRGDWTRQDPRITAALAAYGRSGVPLYLLYVPGEPRARILPQILTESVVLHALQSL